MSLQNLFEMVKADRYTQDGRDQLIKTQEVETEDKIYNIGDISQKTGLQKTANGWVEPPKGGKTPKRQGGADWTKDIPNATTEELENIVKLEAKLPKMSEQSRKEFAPKIEKAKEELAKRGGSKSDGAKFDEYGLPSEETIELKENFLKKEGITDPNKLSNKEFNELAKKLDNQFGINNLELSQELLVAEPEQTISKPTYISQMSQEKQDKVKNALTNYFKNDIGLSGSDLEDAVQNGLDSKISDLSDIESDEVKKALSEDAAPRVLTGDTRIRIRK